MNLNIYLFSNRTKDTVSSFLGIDHHRALYFASVSFSVAMNWPTVNMRDAKRGQIKSVAAFFISVLKPAVASDLGYLSMSHHLQGTFPILTIKSSRNRFWENQQISSQ
jgi:hypothetical protein